MTLALAVFLTGSHMNLNTSHYPEPGLNLHLSAPISTWDEAIPLGNGTMGALFWGDKDVLRVSLDRGDLWDERPSKHFTEVRGKFNWAAMQRMVAENDMNTLNDVFDSNYVYDAPPTKLPAGRIEIELDKAKSVSEFSLNLASAEAAAKLSNGDEVRTFINATDIEHPMLLMLLPGDSVKDVNLKAPSSVKRLGYDDPATGRSDDTRWFEQTTKDGLTYGIYVGWKRVGHDTLLAASVEKHPTGSYPRQALERRIRKALDTGYEATFRGHRKWWSKFWSASQVAIPDEAIARQYAFVRYLGGSASRVGAPPMPLQGVWSADEDSLPPWKGDYHNDLNTQMTYIAYRGAGDDEVGLSFLDFLWDRLPVFRSFAKSFYDVPGAAVPGVMSLAGNPLGGWGMYSLSPTMGAWSAHQFYLHWRTTGDRRFLRTRAYPFCTEIGECLLALLKPGKDGLLKLPLSSSPEIFDQSRASFLKPNSNFDLACMRMLFLALEEMAGDLGDKSVATKWRGAAKALGPFHTKADGTLLLDETTPLPGSHRHLSNLMEIHPFNLITVDGGPKDRETIAASLRAWDSKGTSEWCGYTFSWMACLRARVGDAEAARHNLEIYAKAFILRNGFHANGDQTKSGYSGYTYRPFTLEGNFLAMEAVHEMLLQSWSNHPGDPQWGTIRIFPATPASWRDASFKDLRAEGGRRVSARRENDLTTWLRVDADQSGEVRIRDNFGGRTPKWSREGVRKVDGDYVVRLRSGESLEATFAP